MVKFLSFGRWDLKRRGRGSRGILRCPDNGNRKTHAHVPIEGDFHVMHPEFLNLHAAEKVNIGCAAFNFPKFKIDAGLGDRVIVRIQKAGYLLKTSDASAPTRPEAELEKSDRQLWNRNRADHTDEALPSADFCAHILAENHRLQIGHDRVHDGKLLQPEEPGRHDQSK